MNKQSSLVLPFDQINKDDIALTGGKGANLGELTQAKFPVPPGFCITSNSYFRLLEENNLTSKIRAILSGLDVKDNEKLNIVSKKIRSLILKADIPTDVLEEVLSLYRSLKPGDKNPLVAVRSSATAEDLPDASFAGQQESFLNIKGESNLVQAIRGAYASLFGSRAIYYRENKNFDHFKVALAIPIQLMIQSEISGIMFSINPMTNNKNQIVIEAVWGLGDYIVQGVVNPDRYIVNKDTLTIHSRHCVAQSFKEVYHYPSGVKREKVAENLINQIKLSDEQILKLATIGSSIQKHYFFPQDIEWAIESGKLYLVQSRPITTIKTNAYQDSRITYPPESLKGLMLILRGQPASVGIGTGKVRKIKSLEEIKDVQVGEVLVTPMTSPDFVPAMKKSAAIVTDKGGQTSHAAIVSRELGVPAVVGCKDATRLLKNGDQITVNGNTGEVFSGTPKKTNTTTHHLTHPEIHHTATKVYVNLGEPDLAPSVALGNADGVGLLRAEFMIAQIGIHPRKLLDQGKRDVFVDKLSNNLLTFAQSFGQRPVVYRATDFKTNEYRGLIGGEKYEPQESNPMLGFRGAFRYINDPQVFQMELDAVSRVRSLGHSNLWLMIPFVRTVSELIKVKQIITSSGLTRSSSFKLWMMVEIPSNVILLEDFLNVGIDGVSIGSNDLTMLILGTDRDNETVASEFSELNPAVLWALEKIVKTTAKHNVTCSVCGQAPSQYPHLVEKLVDWGVTSVSVSPDAVDRTKEVIYHYEKRLGHGKN